MFLRIAGSSSSLTSGFPSLEELRRNGSLLERYSTHDGETRSVPRARSNCSPGNRTINKVTFIALPGTGNKNLSLHIIQSNNQSTAEIDLSGASITFGKFGYELNVTANITFTDGDMLRIEHPRYGESSLRLLHQVGQKAMNICWSNNESSESQECGPDYDYPLLAIETGKHVHHCHNINSVFRDPRLCGGFDECS